MKNLDFPITKIKVGGLEKKKFALEDPAERREYFEFKAGKEIQKIRNYLKEKTFVGFLLGKKNSGKGTYSKLFMEAVGQENIAHISVGDIVRDAHEELYDDSKKAKLVKFLQQRYRGFVSIEKVLEIISGRDTSTLLPTEVILALLKREIDKVGRKAIFIDGFPRGTDQIPHLLYFKEFIGYRDEPDFLIFIDVPEAVIDERMKYRVICPQCKTPRNIRVLRTQKVSYDHNSRNFHLICDNSDCGDSKMVAKEGDELGIEAIRERIETDDKIIRTLINLQGIPKIFLRNSVPAALTKEYVDDYEITPAYRYEYDDLNKEVKTMEEDWLINDDDGNQSCSLLAPPVTVSLIKQITKILEV